MLERALREQAFAYLVLYDRKGKAIAASGWDKKKPLPSRDASLAARRDPDVFHTEADVRIGGERHGHVAFGLATQFLQTARTELIRENLAVGVLALLISTGMMVAVAYWLTRNLTRLTDASARLAAGDLTVRLSVHGGDEVAQLTSAFNTMAEALSSRIDALAESRANFTAIADYSYDWSSGSTRQGKLIWINPRVYDMFGYTPEECLSIPTFPSPFISPADGSRTMRQIRKALRGNTGQDFEFRARRKDGSDSGRPRTGAPIYDEAGGYLGIRISIRDIMQRKQAERRLESTVVELRDAQTVQQDYLGQGAGRARAALGAARRDGLRHPLRAERRPRRLHQPGV